MPSNPALTDAKADWLPIDFKQVPEHLMKRIKERLTWPGAVKPLMDWIKTQPEAPPGPWFKDFGKFYLVGNGPVPRTVRLREMGARGRRIAKLLVRQYTNLDTLELVPLPLELLEMELSPVLGTMGTDGKQAGKFKYGTVQAELPEDSEAYEAISDIRLEIEPSDLDGKGVRIGRTHVTVRYGIKTDDTASIEVFLSDQPAMVATLGATSSFPPSESSDNAAVLIAPVECPELFEINKRLGDLGDRTYGRHFTAPDFDYKPHVTIAYVKPEAIEKYVGLDVTEGLTFEINEVVVVTQSGDEKTITLNGVTRNGVKTADGPTQDQDQMGKSGDITETPQFKSWFQGSKVVDDHGRPLRVYHGTSLEFDEFDTEGMEGASFFTDSPDLAQFFAEWSAEGTGGEERVVPVYLSLRNPKRVGPKDVLDEQGGHSFKHMMATIRAAKRDGHDGLHIVGVTDGRNNDLKADQWAAFRPNQIKSALGNNGDFDSGTGIITASKDGVKTASTRLPAPSEANLMAYATKARQQVIGSRAAVDGDCQPVTEALYNLMVADGYRPSMVAGEFEGVPHTWLTLDGTVVDATFEQFDREFPIVIFPEKDAENEGYVVGHKYAWPVTAGSKNPSQLLFKSRPADGGDGFEIAAYLDEEHAKAFDSEGSILVKRDDDGDYFVYRAGVDDRWRGTGLGQLLYDKAIQELRNDGAEVLWSDDDRTKDATAAWQRLGQRYPVSYDAHLGRFRLELTEDPDSEYAHTASAAPNPVAIANEYMHFLKPGLPKPIIRVEDTLGKGWLGRCKWSPTDNPETTTIQLQKSIMGDEQTVRRVIAHELCHHEDLLLHWATLTPRQQKLYSRFRDGHGPQWQEIADRFNQALGPDFVTKKSDEAMVVEETGKEYYLLVKPSPRGSGLWFNWAVRPSAKQKEKIKVELEKGARLFRIGDPTFADAGPPISNKWGVVDREPALAEKLQRIWDGFEQAKIAATAVAPQPTTAPYTAPPAITQNPNFQSWFKGSKVVDSQGNPLRVYRGDYRGDKIGDTFKVNKSTSGRFYFTDDPDIASNYATGKPDNHHVEENSGYEDWFRFPGHKYPGERSVPNLIQAWYRLTPEEKQRVQHVVENTTTNDMGDFEFDAGESIHSHVQDLARRAHGNWLKVMHEVWLESGSLFNEEKRFSELLDKAGIHHQYDNPHDARSMVTPVYLSIKQPLDTSAIPQDVLDWFHAMAKTDRSRAKSYGHDQWDKTTTTVKEWVQGVDEDIKNGTTYAWTTIPEKITKGLQAMGYDGIKDTGGKYTGVQHTVWIAFEPNQIKSALGNKGKFDPNKNSITAGNRLESPLLSGKVDSRMSTRAKSILASPELARFDGMKVVLYSNDHEPPHVHVVVNDEKYRLGIPDAEPLKGNPVAPNSVVRKIKQWFAMRVPTVSRSVADLVYDQWLRVRNHQPYEPVPTPDEIRLMSRPSQPKKSAFTRDHYAIKEVQALPNFHLRVVFKNGETRIADIKAMRGDSPLWAPVYENFDSVENRGFDVAWPVMTSHGPNTMEIEDQDLWGAGVLEVSASKVQAA